MRDLAIVLIALAGCTTASDHCRATCEGCCTAEGACRVGTTNDACGSAGAECLSCGTRSCQLGVCRSSAATGGGTGGSTGGGAGGGGGGSTLDAGLKLRVFVTRSTWNGNLAAAASRADGLAAGDALCAATAADAGFDRTWVAALDSETITLADRLPPGRWQVVFSRNVVEHDDAGIHLTGAINRDERGAIVPPDAGVWTGVRTTADNLGFDCAGWQADTSAVSGTLGITSEVGWNESGTWSCASRGRLYCFQL